MLTMKVTRYFTNGDVEVACDLTFDVLNNDLDNSTKAIRNTLGYEFELPPLEGRYAWREMTDDEAKDYQQRQEAEEKTMRRDMLHRECEDQD